MSCNDFYVKSETEMRRFFSEVPDAIENTGRIAEKCNAAYDFDTIHLPVYEVPEGYPGHAEYLSEKEDAKRMTAIVKASSSLPYVAQITEVDGIPMLDGGIVDSIPVVRAINQGYSPNVVVMTRNRGFRSSEHDFKIPRFIYKEYPRLRVALSHRVEVYNRQLELVERMEDWGEVICIRPERPMEVDRICRDVEKLERLYEEGFALGEKFCREMMKESR